MLLRRAFTVIALASALGRAEPLDPRIAARYRQMLEANPLEGIAVERLWKASVEDGSTEKLIASFTNSETFSGDMVLGHLLRRSGREDEAASAFQRAAKRDAGSPLPHLAIARLESDRTRPHEAALALEKAAALLENDDPRLPDTLLQLGAAWASANSPAKAAEAWERTIALSPGDVALRRRLADSYAANLLYDDALRHLMVIAEKGSVAERTAALQQAAKLHSGAGRPAEALAALEKAAGMTAPGNWLRTEINGEMIRLAQRQHVENSLEEKWRKDALENPRDLGAVLRMVEFYERTGALQSQADWLQKATALAPKSHEYRLRLARVLGQLDQPDAAAAQLDQLIAAQPGDADLVFERARIDLQREDSAAARERISRLLASRENDETLRTKAFEFYQENRLLDLAEESLKSAAASGGSEALQALAAFYFAQKREPDALATLGRLVRPRDSAQGRAAAHFQIAQALKLQTSLSSAADQVRLATELDPAVRDYQIMLGELLTSLGRGLEARPPLERAWEQSKSDAERLEADQKLFASFRARALKPDEDPDVIPRKPDRTPAEIEEFIRELMAKASAANSAAGWLRVARWKAWNGDKGGAMTYASKAAGIDPKDPRPLEFMASHAATNGDNAAAGLNLRALIALSPAGRDGYLRQLAQLEAFTGNLREALRIFEDLSARNPGNPDALADLAGAQERLNQPGLALATWRKAHSIAPPQRKREFSASILRVLQQQEKHQEASEMLLRLVDETADEKEKFARFDELLLHAQQHDQIRWLRAQLEGRRKLRADDYFTAVSLGRVLKLLGENAAAFELFADAVYSAPNQEQALPELIREAEALRRFETAIQLQDQLTRIANQERPDGFLKLAALQEKMGDLEGTERTWTRAVAKFPREFEVLRRAADFHLAWGDATRATALLRKLSVLEPSYLRGPVELGVMEFAAGNFPAAMEAFSTVLKLSKPLTSLAILPTETGESPWTERVSFERGASAPGGIFSTSGRTDVRNPWMSAEMIAISPSGAAPETPGRMGRLIAPTRSGAAVARLAPDAEWRLTAIRGAANCAKRIGGDTLASWRTGWLESAKIAQNEAVWALFFAGLKIDALNLVEQSMRSNSADVLPAQAFVSMALETGKYDRLSRWLEDDSRSIVERQFFSLAFSELLQRRGFIEKDAIAKLFPDGATARLWTSSAHLARQRMMEPAVALGMRAVERFPSDAAFGWREMARWNLALGRAPESRRLLALAAKTPAESFESPALAALHELHALTPPADRRAILNAELAAIKDDGLQAQFRRTLLLRLAGNKTAATTELHRVLDQRGLGPGGLDRSNSAHRELLWLAGAADMFVQWDMPDLAAAVWARTLLDSGLVAAKSRIPAKERVEGSASGFMWSKVDVVDDIYEAAANQLDALRYAMGGPVERAEILAARTREAARSGHPQSGRVTADPEDVNEPFMSLAEALKTLQAWPAAVEVCMHAWERNLESPRLLRELLDACQRAGDEVTAEAVRRRCVEDRINPASDSTLRQFAMDLADQLERRGATGDALRVISGALSDAPTDFSLLCREAQLLHRSGRTTEAEAALRKVTSMDGGTAVARGQLAAYLEERGDLAGALEVRWRSGGLDKRRPFLLFKTGRTDDAAAELEKFTGMTAIEPAGELASAMALAGDVAGARSILVSQLLKIADPRAQFSLRARILTLPGSRPSKEFIARFQDRMRAFAGTRPEFADRYYEFFQQQAARLGIAAAWKTEVDRAWSAPDAPLAAGLAVLESQLAAGNEAAATATIARILAGPFAPRLATAKLMQLLEAPNHAKLRIPVARRIAESATPETGPLEDYIALLESVGNREAARNAIAEFEWLTAFTGNAATLGRLWLTVGEPERARGFFEIAMKERPLASISPALAGMARVQCATGNPDAARILLKRAYAEPSFRDFEPLVDFLARSGELQRWNSVADEVGVRPELRYELKLAIFKHYQSRDRFTDALALAVSNPDIISPVRPDDPSTGRVSLATLRDLAKKSGDFKSATSAFEALKSAKVPDAEPETAMLAADWAMARGEPAAATPSLATATQMRPANWEYVKRAVSNSSDAGKTEHAIALLERFLSVSNQLRDREEAILLWETAKNRIRSALLKKD